MVENQYMTYGGNRLASVRDNATQLTYEGATDSNGEPNKEYPLTYNDAGRKIAKIDYDYLNNLVRIQFEEGYCQAEKNSSNASIDDFTFYYYDKDHLGNIRQVTKADGSPTGNVVQTINYYPFGMQFCDGTTCNIDQKHKYNGKEFDNMHGLNTYDYGARQYNPVTARRDRMDPLCEKYYSISPYAYCCNNPVAYYDVAGLDSVYYNESGIEIQRRNCANSLNFVIKTSQSTAELYKDSNPDQKGVSNPISRKNAILTEEEIRKGNLAGDHMKNVTQFGSNSEMSAMLSSIEDDATGGVSNENNREYSGKFTNTGVKDVKKGSVGDLSKKKNLVSSGNSDWHSHPSGSTTYKPGYSKFWQQAPSKQDIKTANHAEYVVGCGNGTIYKYNKYGIISTCPTYVFSK